MITREVLIEVTWNDVLQGKTVGALPRMTWEAAFRGVAERLYVNEHQLSARSKGLDQGVEFCDLT